MARNKQFHEFHEPFKSNSQLNTSHDRTFGPLSFLNPTTAHFRHHDLSTGHTSNSDAEKEENGDNQDRDTILASDVEFKWSSRNNRKGRHALVVDPSTTESEAKYRTPRPTTELAEVVKGIVRMFTQFPYWDVSWHVAIYFTVGSIVWCINGSFVYLPLVQPSSDFSTEILYGGGITAFIGATIFEIGSVFLMVEAINENRTGCFGWAIEKSLEDNLISLRADNTSCRHHHTNRKNFLGKSSVEFTEDQAPQPGASSADESKAGEPTASSDRQWQWFPSKHDLWTHYLREIGFLACLSQLFGASVFWISGFTALPGINNVMSQGLLDGIYWVPQVIGGSGFVVSSFLFMLETQKNWYTPAFGTLGWHIGVWNLIGAIGFTVRQATMIMFLLTVR